MPNACIKFYVTIDIPNKEYTNKELLNMSHLRYKLIQDAVNELADKAKGIVTDLEIKEF